MSSTRRRRMLFCCLFSAALLFSAGGPPGAGQALAKESTLEKIQREKTVRVGFANEAPYAYASPDGKLVGLMPDVIGHIMAELGVPAMEGVLTDFGGLIPGLLAGRFDLLGAGLYITPPRCRQALPADPQYMVTEAMVVKKGNPHKLHGYADVAGNEKVRIGTLAGSVNAQYLATAKVPSSRVVLFPDLPSAIAGLQGGRVESVTMSSISLQDILQKTNDANLELALPFKDPVDDQGRPVRGYGSAWFRTDDQTLVEAYNAKLKEIKANGQLLELISPYGFTERQAPDVSITAEQLCR